MYRSKIMQRTVMAMLLALPVTAHAAMTDNSMNMNTSDPAVRFGTTLYNQYTGRPYIDLDQEQLRAQWEQARGSSTLSWDQAQPTARDTYLHLYNNQSATTGTLPNMSPAAGGTVR